MTRVNPRGSFGSRRGVVTLPAPTVAEPCRPLPDRCFKVPCSDTSRGAEFPRIETTRPIVKNKLAPVHEQVEFRIGTLTSAAAHFFRFGRPLRTRSQKQNKQSPNTGARANNTLYK